MKKNNLILYLLTLFSVSTMYAQNARVQVIHNSADAAAATVDIYVDGNLEVDDLNFRTASPFIDIPAGVPQLIEVKDASGASTVFSTTETFANNETYVIVADGIVSATGYAPAPTFGLEVYNMARESANISANTDLLIHHGSTDAPTVDVTTAGGGTTLSDDLAYTDFDGYVELTTQDYTIDVRDASGATVVASYEAPLATLGLSGSAITVVASGFLDPSVNSNGAAFGLWAATPAGGALVELPPVI